MEEKMEEKYDINYIKKLRLTTWIKMGLAAFLAITFFVLSFVLGSNIIVRILFLVLFLAGLGAAGVFVVIYNKKIKECILPALLDGVLKDLVYRKDLGITAVNIKPLEMIEQGKTLISSNYIAGKYKDSLIELSDVRIDDVKPSTNGKKGINFILFNGRWYVFQLKYGFVDDVLISNKFSTMPKIGYNIVKTNDINFDHKFRIFSKSISQVNTFLTSGKRKQLEEFMTNIKYDTLLYFHRDRLHVPVNCMNKIPNVSIFKKFDVPYYRNLVYGQLGYIIDLLEKYGFYG